LAGNRWLAGEAGRREVLGRLRAFRHACSPDEFAVEPAVALALPAAVGAAAAGPFSQQQPLQQQCLRQLVRLPAVAVEGAGPFAKAADADGRHQLKRGEAAPLAAAAAAVAPAALAAEGVGLVAACEPPAPRERPLSPCGVPVSLLQPYAQHKVVFAGRNLWCLDCFEVPGSSHRSWRHGRCGGSRSPTFMSPALRDGIRR
jgi:hypothetical protein